MCGIVGLFAKSPGVEERLGEHLAAMLVQMSSRGPDSAGVAVYRDPAPSGWSKLTLFSADPHEHWGAVLDGLRDAFGACEEPSIRASHAVLVVDADAAAAEAWVREQRPELRVMSAGQVIEIYKETGLPEQFAEAFALHEFRGTHALGHTRMATESRVDVEHAHPFWARPFEDIAVVHNGHITNYHKLRRLFEMRGYRFHTGNDTELIAVYIADRLSRGFELDEAVRASVQELDGSFTYLISTVDGFGVARDRFASKPGVIYEDEAIVAVASEEQAIYAAIGERQALTREVRAREVLTWAA